MTGVIHMTPQFGQMLNPHVIPSTKEKRLIACLCKLSIQYACTTNLEKYTTHSAVPLFSLAVTC